MVLMLISSTALYLHDFYCQATTAIFCDTPILNMMSFTVVFLPIFIFSVITYFLKEKTFLAWIKFTLWWVLISFFLIAIIPSIDDYYFFGNMKKTITWVSVGGYAIFATILILVKSWKLRKMQNRD